MTKKEFIEIVKNSEYGNNNTWKIINIRKVISDENKEYIYFERKLKYSNQIFYMAYDIEKKQFAYV